MDLTIGVREMFAWVIALISLTLFLQTLIRNPSRHYYVAVQGLLVACYKKAVFYSAQANSLRESKSNTASLNEAQKIYEFVSNDYLVLTQHIFGVMKSLQPRQNLPFDAIAFIESDTGAGDRPTRQPDPPQPSSEQAPNGVAPTAPAVRGPSYFA